jgi:hypothetical protein
MYYFKLRGDDPINSKINEKEKTIEEMRKEFLNKFIRVGDEPHDVAQIIGIMTEEEANKYFDE